MRIMMSFFILLVVPALASSATLKVPGQYTTIQDAIDAASGGDTVLVAPGTYVENIDFKGKAITVTSDKGLAVTVIDGNQTGSVVTCTSGEGLDSVLDGFTITNGSGNIFPPYWYTYGGGMRNSNSSPTVTFCIFSGNSAHNGGGMYNENSSPTVMNCIFSENSVDHAFNAGGGMYNGDSNPTVVNCTFSRNQTAWGPGGGMCNYECVLNVTNCIFTGNISGDGGGGGIFMSQSTATVANCTFYGNSAKQGGAIDCWYQSSSTITNTILWENKAPTAPEISIAPSKAPSTITMSHSDVKGGQSSVYVDPNCTLNWGAGMIDLEPLFVDSASGDFHLTFPSPCKDTGDNAAVTEILDSEGDPRIADGTVDMGADEFYTHLYWTGNATPGGNVELKFIGLPGTSPVGLCIGTGVLDPPLPSMWGDWYLQFPIIGPIVIPVSIPSSGVMVLPGVIPGLPPGPYSLPMQALIGAELTNICVLEIQ